jgi:chaperonin GroEL
MLLKRGLEKATVAVSAAIKAQAIQICARAELANVAASAAHNPEIGELIAGSRRKIITGLVIT